MYKLIANHFHFSDVDTRTSDFIIYVCEDEDWNRIVFYNNITSNTRIKEMPNLCEMTPLDEDTVINVGDMYRAVYSDWKAGLDCFNTDIVIVELKRFLTTHFKNLVANDEQGVPVSVWY